MSSTNNEEHNIFNSDDCILLAKDKYNRDDKIVCFEWVCNGMNLESLSDAYFDAAKQLNSPNESDSERYCFPILFCYRHYLELSIKDLFVKTYLWWRHKKLSSVKGLKSPNELLCLGKKQIVQTVFDEISKDIKYPNKNLKKLEGYIQNYDENKLNDTITLIESLLKENKKYANLRLIKNLCEKFQSPNDSHTLERYLFLSKFILQEINAEIVKEQDFTKFENLIIDFDDIDNKSMSFRYPFNKDGGDTKISNFLKNHTDEETSLFGEKYDVCKFQNVDFTNLDVVMGKIHRYIEYLKNEFYKVSYVFAYYIQEILDGIYFDLICNTKNHLPRRVIQKAANDIAKIIDNKEYVKKDTLDVVNNCQTIMSELLNLFDNYNNNFQNSEELEFVEDENVKDNLYINGTKVDELRQRLKVQRKKLIKLCEKQYDYNRPKRGNEA